MQRAIQNTQAATRRRSCPIRVAGSTLTANVAFAVLKYAALTAAGVLLFRWGGRGTPLPNADTRRSAACVAFRVAAVLVSDGNHDPRYRAGLPERRSPQMKIKSIAAICKKNKQVVLFNRYSDSGTISQYIGDGSAVYPISGLPELDEESILTIFDVPEKQREDWLVRYRDIPEGISFEDTDATEKIIEQGNLSIVYSGKTLKPLQTRRGLVFIESRYLSPVSDVLDVLELYERVTPFGAPYIVAKAGFLLQAVIMPCDVISAQFVQRLQELTRQCAVSLDLREQERERQAAADTAGQFKVDPETGAIIEPESEAGA